MNMAHVDTNPQGSIPTEDSLCNSNESRMLDDIEIMLLWVSGVDRFRITDFDEEKEALMTTFQGKHNLQITNEVDEATTKKIEEEFESSLTHPDMYPKSIKTLKKSLNRLGYGSIKLSDQMGTFTIKRMNEFQLFYNLGITDDVNIETLQKIIELESSPMQLGNRHHALISFKEMLNMLGFGPITLTDKYGKRTRNKVKEFQQAHNYPVNGMIDIATAHKMREVFFIIVNTPNGKHKCVRSLKQKLNRLGFGKIMVTEKLGPFTVKKVREFQSFYNIDVTNGFNQPAFDKMIELLTSSLKIGKSSDMVLSLKKDLSELGYGPLQMNDKFDTELEKKVKQFQKTYQLPSSGIVDDYTLETMREAVKYKERTINRHYNISLDAALDIQMESEPVIMVHNDSSGESRKATREEVEFYLNPMKQITSDMDRFQFLNLSLPEVTYASKLDTFLEDKGALAGTGRQFIDAGKEYGINEVFLVSQALLATDNGRSPLAEGIPIANEQEKHAESVTKQDDATSINQKVYNVYGLYEGTSNVLEAIAEKASLEKWTTIERSIVEGALLLKGKYIYNGMDTFYKMRWNPEHMALYNKAEDCSVKDIAWSVKQIDHLYEIYQALDGYTLYLDIPNYE